MPKTQFTTLSITKTTAERLRALAKDYQKTLDQLLLEMIEKSYGLETDELEAAYETDEHNVFVIVSIGPNKLKSTAQHFYQFAEAITRVIENGETYMDLDLGAVGIRRQGSGIVIEQSIEPRWKETMSYPRAARIAKELIAVAAVAEDAPKH
jgi:hypothetical protein